MVRVYNLAEQETGKVLLRIFPVSMEVTVIENNLENSDVLNKWKMQLKFSEIRQNFLLISQFLRVKLDNIS